MTKGQLKTLANQKNILAELTIFAEAEQEEFTNVEIITLTQHVKDLAIEQASMELEDIMFHGKPDAINERVNFLIKTEYTSAKEYVLITADSIQIAVNTTLIDDSAIDYALSLLLQVESIQPGEKYEFGERVKPCL